MTKAGEQRERNAFERWVAAAYPTRLWVTLVGVVLVAVCWIGVAWGVTYAYYYGWLWFGDTSPAFEAEMAALDTGSSHLAVLVLLMCTAGFWLGPWLATNFLHRQPFWSLVSPARRINWRWFGVGVLVMLGEFAAGYVVSFATDRMPIYFNQPDIKQWVLFAIPATALIFIQAAGEELAFRGYLMQRLAARFKSPLIWILCPSAVFAATHYFNGVTVEHGLLYVASTMIYAMTAAVLVWRTGDLSAAIGWHVANNLYAILVVGTDDFFVAAPLMQAHVGDVITQMPAMLVMQLCVLGFISSPWGPKAQTLARRK